MVVAASNRGEQAGRCCQRLEHVHFGRWRRARSPRGPRRGRTGIVGRSIDIPQLGRWLTGDLRQGVGCCVRARSVRVMSTSPFPDFAALGTGVGVW